jgi:hypothetical protein
MSTLRGLAVIGAYCVTGRRLVPPTARTSGSEADRLTSLTRVNGLAPEYGLYSR